jgi:predicted enzyme related to lactoylglutathione lyase
VKFKNQPIQWEVCVKDVDRSRKFYESLFGWRPAEIYDKEFWVCLYETGGMKGGISECYEGMPDYFTIFFEVDDIQGTLDKAVEMGAFKIVDPIEVNGEYFYCMFVDLEGNAIGLIARIMK